jgi:thiamine pyrophosphate-dependent acetolactate synthase large subunit-like protein
MGLGALATLGVKKPPNLTIAVLDNGRYGETGMQLTHTALGVDLAGVALACKFDAARMVEDMDGVSQLRDEIHGTEPGLRLAQIRIKAESPEKVLPPRDGVFLKNRFRARLGLPTI